MACNFCVRRLVCLWPPRFGGVPSSSSRSIRPTFHGVPPSARGYIRPSQERPHYQRCHDFRRRAARNCPKADNMCKREQVP
ncbi:expressed unknown protein [Ectocarpus siliculosus]|uniref:Uncharacterized protein n=1 Tax=Ectocarpus siliculosus TaxID=2880 RepID=D7FRU5_ECTSI|nr:expressed unknown protein [Ectocarpus siliculosus]|eukprot:CBJ30886.1 expressed unknown protein [Ectocarpus siliculosus]